jgi:2-iminobutanoate/2-iminopropanoate deaminase
MSLRTRATLERIGRTLKAAGFGWQDVVDSLVYATDPKNLAAINASYRDAIKTGYPARVAVQAGLVSPDALVEIMCTAVK